jgi:hypothetical protein
MTSAQIAAQFIKFPGGSAIKTTVAGPQFHPTDHFHSFEDFYHPRLTALRRQYRLGDVIRGEKSQFRQILKLRHWVHQRWHVDNCQTRGGDAFQILELAKQGHGFHCAHCMVVLHAVLWSCGFVARQLGVDADFNELDRALHHGVNEVWSNEHAKWVLLDAKYDIHFERNGVPLSALEVHESMRRDGGKGVDKMRGVRRRLMPEGRGTSEKGEPKGDCKGNYWWVSYIPRMDRHCHPHWSHDHKLIIPDNAWFRRTIWYRGKEGRVRVKHWAYGAQAFIPAAHNHEIDWTPNVTAVTVKAGKQPGTLAIRASSCTPNFKCYAFVDGKRRHESADGSFLWKLRRGKSVLRVQSVNLFGLAGPEALVTATL